MRVMTSYAVTMAAITTRRIGQRGGPLRSPRRRVGRDAGTDFYTASTSGAVFGELVAAKTATPTVQKTLETEYAIKDGMESEEYKTRMLNRDKLRRSPG